MRQRRKDPITRMRSWFSLLVQSWSCFNMNILLWWAISAALFSLAHSFFHCLFWFVHLNHLQGVLISSHTEESETDWGQTSLSSLDCVRNTQLSSVMSRALRHLLTQDCRLQPWDQSGSGMQKRKATALLVSPISCCGPGQTLGSWSGSYLRTSPWHQARWCGKALELSLSVKGTENSMTEIGQCFSEAWEDNREPPLPPGKLLC